MKNNLRLNKIINDAKRYCIDNKLRLTKPRFQVLRIISNSTKPLGAYDILARLGNIINNPKPPTVYLAIEFWLENKFVHRIESMNAYYICCQKHGHQDSQFLICDNCLHVEEISKFATDNIITENDLSGFQPQTITTEIHGICSSCLKE